MHLFTKKDSWQLAKKKKEKATLPKITISDKMMPKYSILLKCMA